MMEKCSPAVHGWGQEKSTTGGIEREYLATVPLCCSDWAAFGNVQGNLRIYLWQNRGGVDF